jgi:hypothetical protein
MNNVDSLDILFVVWAFLFQVALIVHFSLRRWLFSAYIERYGWLLYVLALPAFVVSLILLRGGKSWSLWLGGVIFLVWGLYGFIVEYVRRIEWRSPIRWSVFVPYVFLYLATVMFYWWPVAIVSRPLWYVYAVLFLAATGLNLASHDPSRTRR